MADESGSGVGLDFNWSPQGAASMPQPDQNFNFNFQTPDFGSGQSGQGGFDWLNNIQQIQNFLQMDRNPGTLSEGWYQGGLNASGGDFGKAGEWLGARRESGQGMDVPLRNAQHAMGQMELEQRAPGFGIANSFLGVPAYTGLKALIQGMSGQSQEGATYDPMSGMGPNTGGDINNILKYLFGSSGDLMNASRPSLQEMWWGMRPIWNYWQ